MASPELLAQLNDLKQQISQLQAIPVTGATEATTSSPIDVSTTGKARLAAGAGGLLGIADMLTFGGAGQLVAGGNALLDALQGKPLAEAYTERAAQTAAIKDFYRKRAAEENATALGMPITELAAGIKNPVAELGLLGESGGVLKSALQSGAAGAGMGAAYPLVAVDVPSDQRLEQAGMGAGLGAVLGAASGAAAGAVSPAEETGLALRRTARGVRKTDYTKTFNNAIIEDVPGETKTTVAKTMNDLIKEKTLGSSIDPEQMYNNLQLKKMDLENQIQDVLNNVDDSAAKSGTRLVKTEDLQFPHAQQFIKEGNFDPRLTDKYWNEIDTLKDAIAKEGQGKVGMLNNFKRGIGQAWSDAKLADPAFSRALYTDLKQVIEKYAPEVADLNKQKQKLLIAEPIIARGKRAADSVTLNAARTMFNTTGGSSLVGSLQAGYNIGAPAATVATNAFLKAAASNRGREAIGTLLQNLDVPAKTIENIVSPAVIGTRAEQQRQLTAEENKKSTQQKPTSSLMTPQKIAGVTIPKGKEYADANLVKAMIATESGGDSRAISPKGAVGLMQIMPRTAKELGIDPTDPAQNVEGGSRYVKQLHNRFGDQKLAIAAYNMGPSALDKAISRAGTTSWPSIIKRLGIYSATNKKGIPQETVNYVNKVSDKLKG